MVRIPAGTVLQVAYLASFTLHSAFLTTLTKIERTRLMTVATTQS